MALKKLNLSQESFPFDYIPLNPKLILKYLNNPKDFYPIKNNVRNIDDIWFGHFNVTDKYEETISTFERRFQRLFDALENKKKILFVYTAESDIYNGYANKDNDTTNYDDLLKIKDFIINKYDYNYDNSYK
jgi:phosphopentomutase